MQQDMHYHGTYAMARAAGLAVKDAKILAYAAQYVDDSTANDSEVHEDGGMFHTTATAHTNPEAIANAASDHIEQRKVWVPFHFFPGNQGETLSQRLKCQKDSDLVREMVDNHISHAVRVKDEYGLALMGIMAHVYADTFSHYGFSGVSSKGNKVDGSSFELDVKDKRVKAYVMGKFSSFLNKYTPLLLKIFAILPAKVPVLRREPWATGRSAHIRTGLFCDGGSPLNRTAQIPAGVIIKRPILKPAKNCTRHLADMQKMLEYSASLWNLNPSKKRLVRSSALKRPKTNGLKPGSRRLRKATYLIPSLTRRCFFLNMTGNSSSMILKTWIIPGK